MNLTGSARLAATEQALRFTCHDDQLIGVLHLPAQPLECGVLVVTGGPQYRVGSHRQFVLLGRQMADAGIAVLRFDVRGMGDSEGDQRDFDAVGDDLRAAINHFFAVVPQLRALVLWGLCDGATAAAFQAANDRRITGLVMLNPWVRTPAGLAQARLRHYYLRRLCSGAFWRKLASGAVDTAASASSLKDSVLAARNAKSQAGDLPVRLHRALERYAGRTLIILAGADLVAREFAALPAQHPRWRRLLAEPRVCRIDIAGANHTFARRTWRDQVAAATINWIRSW